MSTPSANLDIDPSIFSTYLRSTFWAGAYQRLQTAARLAAQDLHKPKGEALTPIPPTTTSAPGQPAWSPGAYRSPSITGGP